MTKDKALTLALEALENLKEVVAAAQALGIKAGATGKDMRLGESFLHDEAITAIKEALAPMSTTCEVQPEHRKLQVKGEHPAPCARHCEATAFQIVIKNLKAQLAPTSTPCEVQPAQEPITWMCNAFDGEACEQSNHDECENPIPLYATPPKQEWVGLTDEETAECFEARIISDRLKADAARIEARLKDKNT